MSVRIYVEGGGNNRDTLRRCKGGFASYCQKLAPRDRWPSIVACGGRQQAFDRFRKAVLNPEPGDTYVLLVDAEHDVTAGSAVEHLRTRDHWEFPELDGHRIFLMVQAMEAWFLADRQTLRSFYGIGFLDGGLPGSPTNIEAIPKDDLEPALKRASKQTKTKGEYHKVRHGFALLAIINPGKVEDASPHARQFHDFLRSL